MTIDSQLFKATLAQWASGVTIVTSVHNGQHVGITASSFSSVSMEPPLILICVAKRLHTHQVILDSGVFAVTILSSEQEALGMRFAGRLAEGEDRFTGVDFFTEKTGARLLKQGIGWLDCRLSVAHDSGDHSIFVGEVVAAHAAEDGEPILYYNRHWRSLSPLG